MWDTVRPKEVTRARTMTVAFRGMGKDLVHFFNEDGLGAIINSSRGIIAAYKQEKYAEFGAERFGEASRAAVLDMIEDIATALANK